MVFGVRILRHRHLLVDNATVDRYHTDLFLHDSLSLIDTVGYEGKKGASCEYLHLFC